ncbi:MAG: helix-turn-helix transcriptional regulator [Pseudonocardiales bacterium]|nr:helix-turn-helix transcriptional regulator [Pseudonocardiales bacterium]
MGTPLKAARLARGWTHPQAIERMRQVAASMGEEIPLRGMRVQLSTWENGRRRPCAFYRRVFCALYQCPPDALGFPPTSVGAGTLGAGVEVVTALLYTAPLTLAELRSVPPARVRLYTEVALADPRTPTPAELTTGLRRAKAEQPAWLDRERLHACAHAAHRATTLPLPVPVAGQVPDWVTTGRLIGSAIATTVFTTPA